MVRFRKKEKKIRIKFGSKEEVLNLRKKKVHSKINLQKYGFLFSFLSAVKSFPVSKFESLNSSNGIELKTLSYRFLKDAKVLKSGHSLNQAQSFLQQTNKFFSSKLERKRKKKIKSLRKKALSFLEKTPFSFSKNCFRKITEFKNFWFLKRKQSEFFRVLKQKDFCLKAKAPLSFSRRIFERRLLLHQDKIAKKKIYKKLHSFLLFRKKFIRSFFKYYVIAFLKAKHLFKYKRKKRVKRGYRRRKFPMPGLFRFRRLKRKKIRRRLMRKWNRKKKWKRRGIFRFFRSRLKYLNYFSVPRHFEINYKTGEILYLGFIDSSSLNLRLPFRLNIRRLTTHFSS